MRRLAILSTTLAFACAERFPQDRMNAAAIRGGYEDSVDVAVVGIFDNGSGAMCTGTLIAPKLVLTAQHCVADIVGPFDCEQTLFGPLHAADRFYVTTRPIFTVNPADFHRVSEVVVPPGEHRVCGQDIALLVLTQPVATNEAMPIDARIELVLTASEAYSAVGYGVTSSATQDGDRRRRRDDLFVDCVGLDCGSTFVAATEWVGDQGVCSGDSGGPALDSTGRVVGVASRGAFDCSSPTYAQLPPYAAWITSEIARASGVVPDAGMNEEDASSEDASGEDASGEDASGEDAGDAGAELIDAGADPQPDAATVHPDAAAMPPGNREPTSGCGCSTSKSASGEQLAFLAIIAIVCREVRRRSSRRSPSARSRDRL